MARRRTRHKTPYDANDSRPFQLSRGGVEDYTRCPACFWLRRVKGVPFPGMPGFNLNIATDLLLKREFDVYREKQEPHPFMVKHGVSHLVPFKHEHLELWEKALTYYKPNHFNFIHKPSNILMGGGLDDVWHNRQTNQIHIVEYKSTSTGVQSPKKEPQPLNRKSLNGIYKIGYTRQLEMYQFIARGMGFDVNDTTYFVYVDAKHYNEDRMLTEDNDGRLNFEAYFIEYEGEADWVANTLMEIRELLDRDECPKHKPSLGKKYCENERFLKRATKELNYFIDR